LGNVSTDGWANANRHGDEHKIMVDCRNDNGLAIFPGSVYAIHPDLKSAGKKKEKYKYEGIPYSWYEVDGELFDLSFGLAPCPEIFVKWAQFGMNKKTMEPFYGKCGKIKNAKRVCPDKITETQLVNLFTGIATEGKYKDSHMEWIKVSYAIIKTCELSGYENRAAEFVDQFSQLGTSGSYDPSSVQHLIEGYKYEFPVENPVSWLLQNYLPRNSVTRDALL